VGSDPRTKQIPLCWPHITLAHDVEEAARIQNKLNFYTRSAAEKGKKPEDMFWDPSVFESQMAEELQRRHDAKQKLEHYHQLVASGKIRPKAPTTVTPRSEQVGHVYYLRVGSYIKIGWTSDITKRMKGYPPDSVLLASEPGTRKDEHRRHRMFGAHRTHGREWYAMTPSLMHHIEQVAAEHGTPDPVTFAAKPVTIPQPRGVQMIKPRGWTGKAS
jgi:hypothetical protein